MNGLAAGLRNVPAETRFRVTAADRAGYRGAAKVAPDLPVGALELPGSELAGPRTSSPGTQL